MENGYLVHHGIKGQKWGVRRYQNKDGSYTSAGKMKRLNQQNESSDAKTKRGLTDRQKKALIVGAAFVGTGLAVYGAHRYRDVLNDRTLKALAVEGKAIADDPSNSMYQFGRRIQNQALISNKQITLNQRVRAYEGSRDPVKIVADIVESSIGGMFLLTRNLKDCFNYLIKLELPFVEKDDYKFKETKGLFAKNAIWSTNKEYKIHITGLKDDLYSVVNILAIWK